MDPYELAGLLKRLNVHMDARCRADGLRQHRFAAAPFGSAYVTISLTEQGPYASSNFNRVHVCGAEQGLTADGMARFADLFRQAGVDKFYVWLSPGPRMEVVRGRLTDASMTRRPHVSYPTPVPRTRSSHNIAASAVANFGFKSDTRIIDLLVSFDSEVRIRVCRKVGRTSESRHQCVMPAASAARASCAGGMDERPERVALGRSAGGAVVRAQQRHRLPRRAADAAVGPPEVRCRS
jgi:hypothetical protein